MPQVLGAALAGAAERPASWRLTYDRAKRLADIGIASSALLLLAPVLVAIYIAVRCDGGPGLFGHTRLTRHGRSFACLKFRTMCVDAEERLSDYLRCSPEGRAEWAARQKLARDPRVTPCGRLLRKASLDELPQLINVLRGEMSLVGPRPVTAPELLRYGRAAHAYLACLPGMTGLWQVTSRRHESYARRVAADAYYARHRSLLLDGFIILRTVPSILLGEGE